MSDEFAEKGRELTSKLPSGLVTDPNQRELWRALLEAIGLPGVVLRRKLRVVPEQFDGRRVEAQLLPWLLAQVGFDDSQPIPALLDDAGQRALSRFAPVMFKGRGTRAGLRQAANNSGPYPAGVFDWFDLRTVPATTPLPYILIDPPNAGAYQTDVHIPDALGDVNRELVEALIKINMAVSETVNVFYVTAFDNGSNGPGQWSDGVTAPSSAPYFLTLESGATYYLETLPTTARKYVAWFAVQITDAATEITLKAHADTATGRAYDFKVTPTAAFTASWTLKAGPTTMASGSMDWAVDAVFFCAMELSADESGTWVRVLVDGNLIAEAVDATDYRGSGTVGVKVEAGGAAVLDFVDVFTPNPAKVVLQHASIIK